MHHDGDLVYGDQPFGDDFVDLGQERLDALWGVDDDYGDREVFGQ